MRSSSQAIFSGCILPLRMRSSLSRSLRIIRRSLDACFVMYSFSFAPQPAFVLTSHLEPRAGPLRRRSAASAPWP